MFLIVVAALTIIEAYHAVNGRVSTQKLACLSHCLGGTQYRVVPD